MSTRPASSSASPVWEVLYFLPWILYGVFLAPGLGEYGRGLWPEWFAPQLAGTESFADWADEADLWTIGTLVIATAIAIGLYWWTVRSWHAKLKTFVVANVSSYHSFVWFRVPLAFGTGAAVAGFAILISEPLRQADVAGWVIFATAVGVFAGLQFMSIVLGRRPTLQLYRGR